MIRRRTFTAGAAFAAGTVLVPSAVRAQAGGKRVVIGWLGTATQALQNRLVESFVKGMAELGRVEGRDYEIVYRFAAGQLDRLPALAQELVKLNPAVIVSGSTPGTIAARAATATIPIVAPTFSDPIGFGLIESQARPGGNVTGLINYVPTLPGKMLSVAKEAIPSANRIGLMLNIGSPQHPIFRRDATDAAAKLGLILVTVEVAAAEDLAAGVETLKRERVDVCVFLQDSMFLNERRRLAELMAAARIPALYSFREHVEDGGLMSYGQKLADNYQRAATFVDKILKGAKPGDLPIEFPTSFELVLNLKAAKALGIEFPMLALAQAGKA